ncbi:MAG: ATP-binding protein [Roseiarcus sp.]
MDAADRAAINSKDVAALVAGSPFAERLDRGAPLMVATGRPGRVEFATPAAFALFGVGTLGALNAAALLAQSPGARRLRRLVEALAPGVPPRVELLRFYAGRLPLPVGLMCARIASSEGRDFLVVAAPPKPGEAEPPAPAVAESVAEEAPRVEIASARRFLWSLDADDRFGQTDRALEETVGSHAPEVGESLAALRARIGLDPTGDFAEAIAAHRTFSALRLGWPEPNRAKARIALISGTPIFDKERRFAGFRGFGLFTDETIFCEAGERTQGEASPPAAAFEVAFEGPAAASRADEPNPAAPPVRDASADSRCDEIANPGKLASPPQPGDRGAEIVVLRQPASGQAGGQNVVPIRPGALSALSLLPEESRRVGDDRESVELTTNERDAFREIARALGAKLPSGREEKPAGAPIEASATPHCAPPAARDLIDLAEPTSPAPSDQAPDAAAGCEPPSERTSEATLRNACALLDRLPIGAIVLRGGEPLYLNQTMLDLVGYRDFAAFRAADGLTHMFRGRDVQTLAEASEGGAMPLVTAGGELIAVDGQVQSIQWDDAPATLIALRRSRDAEYQAQLRALERDARAHEATARDLAAALDSAADGMIALDPAGRIVSMSRPAEALFGYDQNEVAGESFLMLFAPQSQSEAASRFEAVKQDNGNARPGAREELVGRDRRGSSIPLLLAMARLAAPQSPSRYCAFVRNLTQWKAIEQASEAARSQADEASARKTDFLARISHEVRTPLHAILGFAEVMMEERFGPIGNDRYKDYVKDIHTSAKHVVSLADDLLDLSKIEAGKLELEFAPVDANRIVRECVSLMQPQAAQERIIMRLSLFDKLPNLMADERSLRQILLNLMSNAVKFNEPGGQVIVSTALDEAGHPVIRVRDTGVGMNDSEITAALEPFRQLGGARRAGGAGLGLPLTKALAEANHADFSIKSRKEQGTLVEVAFPSVKAAQ